MANEAVFLGNQGVSVAAAGALGGDGQIGNPLQVEVDGTTIQVNGSNELEATGAAASFTTIAVAGQSNIVADSPSDTLTIVAGSNVTLTTNATTDTLTIAASSGGGALSVTKNFTAAQLRTCNSIPLEIVAAPGADKVINFIGAVAFLTFNGVEFSGLTECEVVYDGSGVNLGGSVLEMAQTENYFTNMPATYREFPLPDAENKSLELLGNADDALGDSTLRLIVQYEIVDVP